MVPAAMGTMDRYFENMVKVSYGVMEPKPAVDEIEGGSPKTGEGMRAMLAAALSGDSTSTSGQTDSSMNDSTGSNNSDLQNLFSQFLSTIGNDGANSQNAVTETSQ